MFYFFSLDKRQKMKILHVLLVYFTVLIHLLQTQEILRNVECGPHIDYIETDPGKYRYFPFVVELYRCHGSNNGPNPQNKKCVASGESGSIKKVKSQVFDQETGQVVPLTLQNYTKCTEVCMLSQEKCTPYETFTNNNTCNCKCHYDSSNPTNASLCRKLGPDFKWNMGKCNCECGKDPQQRVCKIKKQIFSDDLCACVCKPKFSQRCAKRGQVLDEATCGCVDRPVATGAAQSGCKDGVTGGVLAVIMIIEALALMVGYFFFYVYCYKKKYLERKASKYSVKNSQVQHDHQDGVRNGDVVLATEGSFNDEQSQDSIDSESNISPQSVISYSSMNIYPHDEKSPLTNNKDEWYLYNDIEETDETPYKRNLVPPSYSEYISDNDHDDEGLASVTQV